MITLFLIFNFIFSDFAFSNDWPKPNYPSCRFYVEAESIMSCRFTKSSYLLDYGYRYCKKYQSIKNKFSPRAQYWLHQVGKCLQEMIYDNRAKRFSNCQELTQFAFDSHPICYKQYDFCDLSTKDKYLILDTINSSDLFSRESFNQILNISISCLKPSYSTQTGSSIL